MTAIRDAPGVCKNCHAAVRITRKLARRAVQGSSGTAGRLCQNARILRKPTSFAMSPTLILLLAVILAAPPPAKVPDPVVSEVPAATDEELLQKAKISIEGPGLLEFFRKRTGSEADREWRARADRPAWERQFRHSSEGVSGAASDRRPSRRLLATSARRMRMKRPVIRPRS